MKRILASSLLLIITLIGCEKNKLAVNTGNKIDSITIRNTADNKVAGTTKYLYNSNGKLSRIINSDPTTGYVYDFSYNTQGQLLTIQTNISTIGPFYLDSMVYNSSSQIVKKIQRALQPGFGASSHAYAYDTQGRLIADSTYSDTYYGPFVSQCHAFEYTGDNVTTVKNYAATTRTSALVLRETEKYQYDNKINPFAFMGITCFMYNGGAISLSRNNFLSVTYTNVSGTTNDGLTSKSTTYFDNDLPQTIIYKGGVNNGDSKYDFLYK